MVAGERSRFGSIVSLHSLVPIDLLSAHRPVDVSSANTMSFCDFRVLVAVGDWTLPRALLRAWQRSLRAPQCHES